MISYKREPYVGEMSFKGFHFCSSHCPDTKDNPKLYVEAINPDWQG